MNLRWVCVAAIFISAALAGCGDGGGGTGGGSQAESQATATATQATEPTAEASATPASPGPQESRPPTAVPTATSETPQTSAPATSTPTPTPTATDAVPSATPLAPQFGPEITYFGVSSADDHPVQPIGSDSEGRPIYPRLLGSGMSLIVEARPGDAGRPIDVNGFDESGALPGLQMILSRPLGDGNSTVCDIEPPLFGGVPATIPFAFSDEASVVAAINDLGCRVNDGTGLPLARSDSTTACTRGRVGGFAFVDDATQVQFCLPIAAAWTFLAGDTVVAARVADDRGNVGFTQEIVVRVDSTPFPRTIPPTPTPTSLTPVPTATQLPPEFGPEITHLGITMADDLPIEPSGVDAAGRPIYERLLGHGLSIVVEARRGPTGRFPNREAYDPGMLPGLQMIVSRPLGDGNPTVCDIEPPDFGGVPATVPFAISDAPAVVAAINDLGCRVNDGTGTPVARDSNFPCTRRPVTREFEFVSSRTEVQFCVPIANAWTFPPGDTVVAARVADGSGLAGLTQEMVVRVGEGTGSTAVTIVRP
jgi:hypothetical protein